MKKIVSYILLFILMVSIPSFSYAQNIKKENVPNGTYIIGTYSFDKNKTANYNGTLTTQMIMLASKSINTTTYNNMVIYFKNSRGKWINAITGKEITSVPSSFEITCANLNCQSSLPATSEGYVTYTNGNVGNGSYIIGNFLFDKNKTANYNGTLTTQMIMLAAKSITSNNLNDMIIYYKNSRGKWVNAINNQAVSSVPQTFNISYIDLTKTVTKPDDKITVTKKTINYTGDTYTAFVTTLSGLTPTITYYSNSTCTTQATPKEAGLYYIKATTAGNSSYNAASLGCTLAIEIKKIDAVCPIIADYTGTYDKKAHSISVNDISDGGTIEYKTDSAWQTTNPTRTDAGQTTVYVHVAGDNNHNTKDCGSKKITINKANDKITVKKKSYVYDGSVKKPTITVTSGLTPTITYYSDSTCSTKTVKNTNSTSNGGAPYAVGTYYVKGSTAGNTNYNAATLACTEAVTIKSEKTNDEITVVNTTVPYTGSAIPASVETLSDLTPSLVYYSNSTCTIKTTTSNASSAGGAPIKVGTYYVTGSTAGNSDYNAATLSCTEALTITKRTVSITAPKLNSTTLTYNGSAQTISKTAGSCTAGGTMYYYTKNYTTTTAPTFDTTNWSTTYPTIKQTNAGTYYLWYYCKVDDLTNNTGTNINKAINVNKAIGKKATTLSLSATSGTLTYGSPVDVTITTDGDGNITCSSSDDTVATCTVDNTNKKITVTPKANTADSKKATITVSQAEGTNYKATSKTYTATVNRKTLSCPTSPADKTYNGTDQASGITCPTGSKAGGDQTKKNAGSYAQTCTANAGYKFSSICSVAWKINKRTVTVTAPKANTATLTYNGSDQTISGTAGSCTTGGTMYYYTKNYTTTTAPTFDTTNWSTTYPTAKGKNARKYYMWYYCKVDDTANNEGTNINSAISVTKTIGKKATTMSLSATSGTLTYGSPLDVTITTDGDGNITCSSSDETVATCTVDNTNKKLTITPKANTADNKKATITLSQAEGTNYKAATDVTYTATVNRKTLSCPTSPADKTYNGTDQASGITCPTGSKAGGDQTKKDAGNYAQTCTANAGYKFASTCSVPWIIKKKNSTIDIDVGTAVIDYGSAMIISDGATVNQGEGELTCSSNNESYATCTKSKSVFTITNTYTGTGNKTVKIKFSKPETTNYNSVEVEYTITVKGITPVTSVDIEKTYVLLDVNGTSTLAASISPTNATIQTLTWSSSNTAVATVSSTGKVTAKAGGIAIITATSSNGKKDTCVVAVRYPKSNMSALFNDGAIYDSGSGRYSYAPSVFITSSNDVYIYTCANPSAGNTFDHIFLLPKNNVAPQGSYVLSPAGVGSGQWDEYHNCDPSIVEGNFTYNGETYKYAMAYTGINNTGIYNYQIKNKIGIAVSNSLTGGWQKVDINPIIDHSAVGNWGVGQPSLLYVDNKLILIYTNDIGSTDPILKMGMQVRIIDPNGFEILGSNYVKVNKNDWMHNADFAYKDNRLYVVFEGPEHDPNRTDIYNGDIISSSVIIKSASISNLTDINAYSKLVWEDENVVDESVTSNKRNTNAGFFRGPHGELYDRRIAFTATNINGNATDSSNNVIGHFYYNVYQTYF